MWYINVKFDIRRDFTELISLQWRIDRVGREVIR